MPEDEGERKMTDYRRADFPGTYYFFTLVTHYRRRFLTEPPARDCLHAAWKEARQQSPFEVTAVCLLPDHLHCVWLLPEGDHDFSLRWSRIKAGFTRRYLDVGGTEDSQSQSRIAKRERGIWQRRFWEHQIHDERDLQQHVDYIHYNPVKHGLVERAEDWPWSSYHRYIRTHGYSDLYWAEVRRRLENMEVKE